MAVIGGGAAGFFGGIAAADSGRDRVKVTIYEKGPQFLTKVRISGGGRCNVTHHLFDVQEFVKRYPRGERALIGAFKRFQAADTIDWFESRGVKLKVEEDGRMFPITDRSDTVIDCLLREARKLGVELKTNAGIAAVERTPLGFRLVSDSGEKTKCDKILFAIGGCRSEALCSIPKSLGHTIVPPVPSLFTFNIALPWLRELSGISLQEVVVFVPGTTLEEKGPILITHAGLSGPAILRLSAWGARELHSLNYNFLLNLDWLPNLTEDSLRNEMQKRMKSAPAKLIVNWPIANLPARLWRALVLAAGLQETTRWSELGRQFSHALIRQIKRSEFSVVGKALNKDEFVTCGGIPLNEVNFKTMESRICPGLYFAGEVLDIDGVTGGFNFQAAWTTGRIAGEAMTQAISDVRSLSD